MPIIHNCISQTICPNWNQDLHTEFNYYVSNLKDISFFSLTIYIEETGSYILSRFHILYFPTASLWYDLTYSSVCCISCTHILRSKGLSWVRLDFLEQILHRWYRDTYDVWLPFFLWLVVTYNCPSPFTSLRVAKWCYPISVIPSSFIGWNRFIHLFFGGEAFHSLLPSFKINVGILFTLFFTLPFHLTIENHFIGCRELFLIPFTVA